MKPKILIVEDEHAIADTIQYALETEGFTTECVATGEPVISILGGGPVDLVILDIGLPDVSGLELCKDIRRQFSTPIIFLTARGEELDKVVGLEIGADDYVTKPFSPRELSARVKAVLRRTQAKDLCDSTVPVLQTFHVNDSKRRIVYHGQGLELSRTEYDILLTFIRRPGHVYSREQLMELVWEEPEASLDRTVDAHIKNIRAKLKAVDSGCDPIVTHRGMGYSLKESL